MPDTVADVLVRLGVDTAGLRSGFSDARNETSRFITELGHLFAGFGGAASGPLAIISSITGGSGGSGGAFSFLFGGIGKLFSWIGGLFTSGAKRAARQIQSSFEEIVQAFNYGSLTIGQAIDQLEAQRAEAIRNLSGRKGGRDQLNQLIPEFDSALLELRNRQKAIFEQFDLKLALLRTGEAFRDVAADVRDVITQYRTYVDAGGDLARANDFLSRSLEQLRTDASHQLQAGEESAIEDALRLNDLLLERQKLLADSAEEERQILSRGVLERQQSVAQQKSAEIEAVRRQRDERLAELDSAIQLQQLKVDTESRVFDLARDRVALETRLIELKAEEFEREAAQLAALKEVVAGIVPGAGGFYTLTPALQQVLNLGDIQIVVGQGATTEQARAVGQAVIEEMLQALLLERQRLGLVN
jgi:hypothetical protein